MTALFSCFTYIFD